MSTEFEEMLSSLPDSESEILARTRSLEAYGQVNEAIELLEEAGRRCETPTIYHALAALLLKNDHFERSAEMSQRALSRCPDDIASVLVLAEAELKSGRPEDAARALKRAEDLGASRLRLLKIEHQLPRELRAANEASRSGLFESTDPDLHAPSDPTMSDDDGDPFTEELDALELEIIDPDLLAPDTNELDALESDTLEPEILDPDTNELESLDTSTLESQSLELNAFERGDSLEDSDIFNAGSFASLSSIGTLDELQSAQTADHERVELQLDDSANATSGDPSVDDLLVDLGMQLGAAQGQDHEETRSLRGPVDEILGIQRDDLQADDDSRPAVDSEWEDVADTEYRVHEDGVQEIADSEWEYVADTEYHIPDDVVASQQFAQEMHPDELTVVDVDTDWLGEDEVDGTADPSFFDVPGEDLGAFGDEATHLIDLESRKAAGPAPQPRAPYRTDMVPGLQRSVDHAPGELGVATHAAGAGAGFNTPHRRPSAVHRPTLRSAAVAPDARPAGQPPINAALELLHGLNGSFSALKDRLSASDLLKYLKFIIPALLLVLVVGAIALAGAASSSSVNAINEKLARWEAIRAPDTYRNYLAGEKLLGEALETHGFLGESFDSILSAFGLMKEAEKARTEAFAELVQLKAMLEYRYEYVGTHGSDESIKEAQTRIPDDARIDIARAYRLLAQSRYDEAITLLGKTRRQHPGLPAANIALIHAQLDAENIDSAAMVALPLREQANLSVHEHYLLGLIDQQLGATVTADARFYHILETLSPAHIPSRISRSYSLRKSDDPDAAKEANALLKDVFEKLKPDASPLQLALAHIARGKIAETRNEVAEAEADYRKAIKLIPQRSKVYLAIVERFIADGRLEKGLTLISDAAAAGVTSPQLVLYGAEIHALSGHPEVAIQTIGAADLDSAQALFQTGMARLDLGQKDEATQAFQAALKQNEKFAPARAYQLLLEERTQTQAHQSLDKAFEKLIEREPRNPHVLRAAALGLLHVAGTTEAGKEREALVTRAKSLLDDALKYGGNPAVLNFDLCHHAMLTQQATSAFEYCEKARRNNDRYLPGMLTMAKLLLRAADDPKYADFFDTLIAAHPSDSRVSHYHALNYLKRHDFKGAEAQINRWAGTPAAKLSLHLFTEGRLAFARHDYRSALGYFQRAHTESPGESAFTLFLAHTLARLGEYDRAEETLKPVLEDLTWEPVAWIVFGEIRRGQRRLKDAHQNLGIAIKKLDDAIKSPERMTQVYVQSALTYADEYGFEHALVERELNRAAEQGLADDPALNMALSRHYLALKRPDRPRATKALEKVIEAEPFNCQALKSLRTIYGELDASKSLERIAAQITEMKCGS